MENVLALAAATAVLVIIPGPNVALIVATSLRAGARAGLVTTLGTTFGVALQLLVATAGLAALLSAVAGALTWIKWLGVAYLLYLGIRTWRTPPVDLEAVRPSSHRRAFWRGAGFAFVNPKTLLFNAAFLPQFVTPGSGAGVQLMLLAAVYLAVIVLGDSLWAVGAAGARRWLSRFSRLQNRLAGGFLVGAGIGLALSRRVQP